MCRNSVKRVCEGKKLDIEKNDALRVRIQFSEQNENVLSECRNVRN